MRRMILRMIASGSLSAFSASALQGLDGVRAPGAGTVQPVRTPPVQASGTTPQAKPGAMLPGQRQPGQALPRGSLLDLSV
jgi:hypothetical protein